MKILSIIVPVYNVEKYIRTCIESIFKQGLEDSVFEVIIVNDGTKDRSIVMIEDIIQTHNNITVINQENQGLSIARNKGIELAKGEYIAFVDSDDLLIDNSLTLFLKKCIEKHPDLIVANYLSMFDEEIANYQIPTETNDIFQETTGEQLLLNNLEKKHNCFVWRTLYKRAFLIKNQISFYPNIVYEDIPFTHECYLKAQFCMVTQRYLYIYRRGNPTSITFSSNKKKIEDLIISIAETWKLTQLNNTSIRVRRKIENDVFASFSYLIRSLIHATNFKNLSEKADIISSLRHKIPNLNFKNNSKQRVASFMLSFFPRILFYIFYYYVIFIEEKGSSLN